MFGYTVVADRCNSGTSIKFIRSGLLTVVLKNKQKSEETNSPEGGKQRY